MPMVTVRRVQQPFAADVAVKCEKCPRHPFGYLGHNSACIEWAKKSWPKESGFGIPLSSATRAAFILTEPMSSALSGRVRGDLAAGVLTVPRVCQYWCSSMARMTRASTVLRSALFVTIYWRQTAAWPSFFAGQCTIPRECVNKRLLFDIDTEFLDWPSRLPDLSQI